MISDLLKVLEELTFITDPRIETKTVSSSLTYTISSFPHSNALKLMCSSGTRLLFNMIFSRDSRRSINQNRICSNFIAFDNSFRTIIIDEKIFNLPIPEDEYFQLQTTMDDNENFYLQLATNINSKCSILLTTKKYHVDIINFKVFLDLIQEIQNVQ